MVSGTQSWQTLTDQWPTRRSANQDTTRKRTITPFDSNLNHQKWPWHLKPQLLLKDPMMDMEFTPLGLTGTSSCQWVPWLLSTFAQFLKEIQWLEQFNWTCFNYWNGLHIEVLQTSCSQPSPFLWILCAAGLFRSSCGPDSAVWCTYSLQLISSLENDHKWRYMTMNSLSSQFPSRIHANECLPCITSTFAWLQCSGVFGGVVFRVPHTRN